MNTLTKDVLDRKFYEQNVETYAPSSLHKIICRKLENNDFTIVSKRNWLFRKKTFIKLVITSGNSFWGTNDQAACKLNKSKKVSLSLQKIAYYLEQRMDSRYSITIEQYTCSEVGFENSGKTFNEYKLVLLLCPK